jgi:hypothetical protein
MQTAVDVLPIEIFSYLHSTSNYASRVLWIRRNRIQKGITSW